ncbi:MAG: peptidyl-prolyl cis-trans isomerase [Sphingomonas sp.]
MLSLFRRLINSRIGAGIAIFGLILIALAFGLGDVTGLRNGALGGGQTANDLVTVGHYSLSRDELRRRIEDEVQRLRQQRPDATTPAFIAAGGFESALEQSIDALAMRAFGEQAGIVIGPKAIDGQIASIPAFKGPDGKFDKTRMDQVLGAQRMTVAQLRSEIAQVSIAQQLAAPVLGASQVPDKLAQPYAALLLEKRTGAVGFVPAAAFAKGITPSEQDIARFYAANQARYLVPERRVLRYAVVSPDSVKAAATPTEAQIAAAYKAKAADYAAHETRTLSQVVVGDKGAADALAAKVKAGTPIDAAAKAAGLEAAKLEKLDKAGFSAQAGSDVANAAFAAAKGAVLGPVKGGLGWLVIHVDAVDHIAAKTLDQARPDIVKALTEQNTATQLLDIRKKIDAALNGNATFADITNQLKLTPVTSTPLTADGRDPTKPEAKPDPQLAQVIQAGFAGQPTDAPQLVAIGKDGGLAIVSIDRVIAAAPAPLAEVKNRVTADIIAERAGAAAAKLARAIVAKVDGGATLAAAMAGAGVPLPPVKPVNAQRAQLVAQGERVSPLLALLFSIHAKSARQLPSPDGQGWYILYLDTITPGSTVPPAPVVAGMRRDIGRSLGDEYVAQLALAARKLVGVKRNAEAIAKLRAELAGTSGGALQP